MRNLVPWRKKEDVITSFQKEMSDMFTRFFKSDNPFKESIFDHENLFPQLDIKEGKKMVAVKADIPGVDVKDIEVSIVGRNLTIKGEKKDEREEKEADFHRMERSYGAFRRTVQLPCEVDESDIEASYKKGVLTVKMKKTKESEIKTIEIKTE